MLTINNFGFKYEGSEAVLLDSINWEVGEGEIGLLEGPTGSGKSTLLYTIAGFTGKYVYGQTNGNIEVNGLEPSGALREGIIYYVPQEPTNSFAGYDVITELMWRGASKDKATQTAMELGIGHLLKRQVFRLSGGEAQKVAIAAAILGRYKIILFDEPLANLDSASRASFISLLQILKKKKLTVIVAEHRTSYFNGIADRTLALDQQKSELTYEDLKIPPINLHDDILLKISNLSFSYGSRMIIKNFNLSVRRGEVVGLIGDNGSGKSTLLKLITGMIKGKGIERNFRSVGFSMQTPELQFLEDTVEKEIKYGAKGEAYRQIAGLMGLDKKLDRLPHSLSRGERVRVAVSSAAAIMPDLIILDEPTEGQDSVGLKMMEKLIMTMANAGSGVIIITQESEFASKYCDRIVEIGTGASLA
ncbi:MAG: ABC transporter ATP-binding protein [Nitrososphaeria archaeon]